MRKYEEDIRNALSALKRGEVILYPTDTIWGLGCDAANSSAVEKIFRIKSRNESKSLIILVSGVEMLERYVRNVPGIAYELANVSDSPLTIIYPEGKNLSPLVCGTDGSVAIRICNDDFCNEMITRFRKPVVSTSANISDKQFPSNYMEVDETIINNVDYVVKHRQNDRRKCAPSPVIKIDKNGVFEILRM